MARFTIVEATKKCQNYIKKSMSENDKIICTCANLSEKKIDDYFVSKNNTVSSFQEFLNDTRAGTFCTACRLDLETIFIKKNQTDFKFHNIEIKNTINFKKKIYHLVDKVLPKITLKNQNYFPILHIKEVEFNQSIWVTNMRILSEKLRSKIKIDDVDVEINLYNSRGLKVWSISKVVKVDSREIFVIPSEKILEKDFKISIGWVEVLRNFKINCSKGTTRPQIMVYTKNSNCAVHGQDIGFTKENSHSSLFRPDVDIQILTFINPSNKTIELKIEPPLGENESLDNVKANLIKIKIPPRGSTIYNINNDDRFKSFLNKYFTLVWKGSGKYKSHIYCISKNFRYISLDHL